MSSAIKRGALAQSIDNSKKKQKVPQAKKPRVSEPPFESEELGVFEESAEGSRMGDDEIQLSGPARGSYDWNRCFVLDCKRVSDRYLNNLGYLKTFTFYPIFS
jgi:hypothetical protein